MTQKEYLELSPEDQRAYYNEMHEYCMWKEAMKAAGLNEMMVVTADEVYVK